MKSRISPFTLGVVLAFVVFIAVLAVMIFNELQPDPLRDLPDFDPDKYLTSQEQARISKRNFLRYDGESPVPDSLQPALDSLPLRYYPVDLDFRLLADFERLERPDTIRQADGYSMVEAGWLQFRFRGADYRVKAFQDQGGNAGRVFVPFADSTTGRTTYAGGRLVDAPLLGEQAILDFNLAYNPFCVFNYTYKCPIPPPENRLPFAVKAGEKDFHWPDELL